MVIGLLSYSLVLKEAKNIPKKIANKKVFGKMTARGNVDIQSSLKNA